MKYRLLTRTIILQGHETRLVRVQKRFGRPLSDFSRCETKRHRQKRFRADRTVGRDSRDRHACGITMTSVRKSTPVTQQILASHHPSGEAFVGSIRNRIDPPTDAKRIGEDPAFRRSSAPFVSSPDIRRSKSSSPEAGDASARPDPDGATLIFWPSHTLYMYTIGRLPKPFHDVEIGKAQSRMITNEFLDRLREAGERFDWQLAPQPQVSGDRRSSPRRRIRAASRRSPARVFDPIGAVCYDLTGQVFDEDSWMDAAETIRLSLIDAGDVIAATNDRVWRDAGDDRKPDPYLKRLRLRMIETVGLQ